jgi:hypothetical protein
MNLASTVKLSSSIAAFSDSAVAAAAIKSPLALITAVIAAPAQMQITPYVMKGGISGAAKPFAGLSSDEAFLTTPITTARKSPFIGVGAHAVHPFSRDFNTQSNAADYIADHMVGSFNGPAVDKKVHDAVLKACNEWKPGQDLSKLVHDEVLAALTGVLPSDGSKGSSDPIGIPIPDFFKDVPLPDGAEVPQNPFAPQKDRFDFPQSAEAVANLMAAQIRANGRGVDDVAEHMYRTPISAVR